MSSTPLTGEMSFSAVKSLTTDKIGYTPPANVSIGTLASVVRQYGQKAPGSDNIAFSNFRESTIGGYVVVTTSESFKQYYANNNDGTITVWFRSNTFKNRGDGNYYVRVTAQQDGDSTVDAEAKLINWSNWTQNFIRLPSQDSGNYTVTVSDLTTGALIGRTRVNVAYNGSSQTYNFNA